MQLHFLFAREAIAAIPYKTLMDLHATIYNDSMPELFSSFLIKSVYKWDIVSWRGNTFDSKQSTRISSQMCEAVERKSQGQSNAKLLIPVYTHTVSCRHNGMMMCVCVFHKHSANQFKMEDDRDRVPFPNLCEQTSLIGKVIRRIHDANVFFCCCSCLIMYTTCNMQNYRVWCFCFAFGAFDVHAICERRCIEKKNMLLRLFLGIFSGLFLELRLKIQNSWAQINQDPLGADTIHDRIQCE